jgi:class 3 adenylate cyclase
MTVEPARGSSSLWVSGVVTIFFSDIEGFTSYTERHGDAAAYELLEIHHALVREELQRHGGQEVKTLGDGFMAVFPSVRAALLCATQIQKRLAEHNRLYPEKPLRVRIGLHAGEPLHTLGDFIGQTVNLAARIAASASGGQIFISDVVRQLAGNTLGLRFEDRGWRALKGIAEKQHLYEVLWEEPPSWQPRLQLPGPSPALSEVHVAMRLRPWRLLGMAFRLLFRRQHIPILLPFVIALALYYISNYVFEGPPVKITRIPEPSPAEEKEKVQVYVKVGEFNPWFLGQVLLITLISPLVAGMTVRMIVNAVEGQRLLPRSELWSFVLQRYKSLLYANVLYAGITTISILGLVLPTLFLTDRLGAPLWAKLLLLVVLSVPGVYVFLRCTLYLPRILLENSKAWESLKWSWRATAENMNAVGVIVIIPVLLLTFSVAPLYNFIATLLTLLSQEPWQIAWNMAVFGISKFFFSFDLEPFGMLINPWSLAALTLAYLQLRENLTVRLAQHLRNLATPSALDWSR